MKRLPGRIPTSIIPVFSMCLRRQGCLRSFAGFSRLIYCRNTTRVEFAGRNWRQYSMARSVRQGCPSSVFRWLQNTIIPRNPAAPDFLQPSPCAYADDFAVAASSFRLLMTALFTAFKVGDQIAGLNLNHRKCSIWQ